MVNGIFNRDCYDILQQMPDKSVALFLQDTPFGCTQNDWDIKPDLQKMWPEWLRVAKDNCAMIFFATQPFASELILSQPKLFRYDLIWYKPLGTGHLNANKMPLRNHEYMLVFYRSLPTYNPQMGIGKRKTGIRKNDRNGDNYGKFSNTAKSEFYDDGGRRFPQSVIEITNGDRTIEADHPTQKPVALIRYLIRTYSNECDLVFDGYGGSGTTAEACEEERRKYIVCETELKYYELTINRVARYKSQPKLELK